MSRFSLCFEWKQSKTWLYLGGAALAGVLLVRTINNWRRQFRVRQKINMLRHERELSLRNLERRLEGRVDLSLVEEVGSLPIATLARRLKSGQLKPTEVLRVYQWRALQSHRRTNCLLRAVDEAEDWALQLERDESRSGALYGIPVSLKENIALKGYRYSHGVTTFTDFDINDRDTVIVEVLREQGAIPFVITNYPQTYMSLETQNPIYGVTSNPLDTSRTPGGSSGGEAALLASGGSILGVGSDVGGSIRCPCHFCGICGFKPTYQRMSQKGEEVWGQTLVCTSSGPMAKDVDGLVLAMKALFVQQMHVKHRTVPPMPFRDEEYAKRGPLRIGFHVDDGYYLASPACARAVMMAREVLTKKGHSLVAWSLGPRAHFGRHIWNKAVSADQGAWWSLLGDDPVDPCVALLHGLSTSRPSVRRVKIWLAKLTGNRRWADYLVAGAGASSVAEWWQYIRQVEYYQQEVEESWNSAGLDALICPAAVTPACKIGHAGELYQLASYAMIYSALNYPAGVIPVTKVNAQDIARSKSFHTGDPLDVFVRDTVGESAEGLPVGVQCVTRRWRDELCLRVLKEIQDGLNTTAPV